MWWMTCTIKTTNAAIFSLLALCVLYSNNVMYRGFSCAFQSMCACVHVKFTLNWEFRMCFIELFSLSFGSLVSLLPVLFPFPLTFSCAAMILTSSLCVCAYVSVCGYECVCVQPSVSIRSTAPPGPWAAPTGQTSIPAGRSAPGTSPPRRDTESR